MGLVSERRQINIEHIGQARSLVQYEYYKRNPLEWLRNCVWTYDEHEKKNSPIKRYPIRPYIPQLVKLFFAEDILLLPKSRQITATWLIVALSLHEVQFNSYWRTFLMSKKEDAANDLIKRMRFIYTHQPLYLRNLCPTMIKLKDQPMNQIEFKNGSVVQALPQGPDQVRQYTVSRLVFDEAAIQDRFEEVWDAAQPSLLGGGKLVALSSVRPGFFQKLTENE